MQQGYISDMDRDQLVEKYLPMVNRMANRLAMGLPAHVERDDLVSSGVLGLLDALEKYNPVRGPMKNYVALRVQGAMLDELRKMSWLPRSLLAKTKELEKAYAFLQGKLNRTPTEKEAVAYLKIDEKEMNSLLAHVNSKSLLSLEDYLFAGEESSKKLSEYIADDDSAGSPEGNLMEKEQKKLLAEAIETLTEREQLVLHLYYREELTLKEVGRVMEITESRVSQIHSKVMIKLKQQLKEWLQ